jgi:hypothetical protein
MDGRETKLYDVRLIETHLYQINYAFDYPLFPSVQS